MGLRFRRSLTIIPGVRLNFGTGGASLSVGPRGASVNVGPRGTFANVGLPGTGLSYRQRLDLLGGRSSGPSVENREIPCSISLDGDRVDVTRDDGEPIDEATRTNALRQNADAVRAMLQAAADDRNTGERDDALPRVNAGNTATSHKPVQAAGETRESYMGRLGSWRASCANDAGSRLVAALEAIDWGRQTDIECGLDEDQVSLRIDLPEIDETGEWRPAPRGQAPGLVRRPIAQNEINRRYARTCASIARTAIDAVLDGLPTIYRVTVHAQSRRDGRVDNLIVADVRRDAWKASRNERDDEMFIARVGGAMQATSTGRLKPQRAITT